MKKNLLHSILGLALVSTTALAQPVLTASGVNPVVGDLYTLNYGNYVSPGSAGANQTWNLSTMTPSSTITYTVGTVASAPNSSVFNASSNMQMTDGSNYQYLNISSTAYQSSGDQTNMSNIVYTNNEDILHYPFNMGNTFTDSWAATFSVSTYAFNRTGNTTVTYDGYGTLNLPTGSFTNVMRVHVVESYTDASQAATLNYVNDEYIWLVNNHHQPIAGVTSLTFVTGANTNTAQSGFYSSNVATSTSIKTFGNDAASLVNVFPNPATETVSFSLRNGLSVQQVSLFDQLGNLVLSQKAELSGNGTTTLRLDGFSSGIYIARILMENGACETQKITVVK